MKNKQLQKINKILSHLKILISFKVDHDNVEYVPIRLDKNQTTYRQSELARINLQISYDTFLRESKKEMENYIIKTIAHEIGHYLVVPPKRRRQRDYGIPIKRTSKTRKFDRFDIEEYKALAIEKEIYDKIGHKIVMKDYRKDSHLKAWWNAQGKTLVDNLFYIVGI